MSFALRRRRLVGLMGAGLVDSLCLSVAWTVLVLQVNHTYGLAAAGLCSAGMLLGVALSAPVAGWMSTLMDGRRLLRTAAGVEATLRLSVFLLLFCAAPLWALVVCVAAMNVTAWTGYAGMRAEVAAVSPGPRALTWYGTVVAAVEAVGVAVGALLPVATGPGASGVLVAVLIVYVLALAPTAVVAGGSPVRPSRRVPRSSRRLRRPAVSAPAVSGVVLLLLASPPTLLAVALAAQLHGRASVALAAVAFTAGSLAAPAVAARIDGRRANAAPAWILCAVGLVAGWTLAPVSVPLLCLAQLMSGLFMTCLEGLLDASAARRQPHQVTGALARATAGRALGSAAGTAVLPLAVTQAGLQPTVAAVTLVLLSAGACWHLARRFSPAQLLEPDPGVATRAVAEPSAPAHVA